MLATTSGILGLVATVLSLDPSFDVVDDLFFMASHGEPSVILISKTCKAENCARSLVCRSKCKNFIDAVW